MNTVHYCHLIVFVLNNKNSGLVVICHEDMIGKRGENVTGISVFPISVEFQYFGGRTLYYSIMMMSLHYIANDIISLSQNYK